ncbi:DEAD/DEAH box helicase [Blastopirellula sp. JC732]|uniref:DEAD/DEAH box helicase n=1 Tax=Blastopirellula sediminis TaxID=2894196 RepID=A0A9X1MH09_9BACT|nr:DEAD/DEAH box helicase [Blastopirellula sediminis]MCC9604309.1 DEAD/DEAH box helicase [Blastopirellula sediminis]MCC9626829.1 DEAD/DEAH box helicase [Blastopirellula sediminis]
MSISSFRELQLSDAIQDALAAENYHTPTPIQGQAIPHLLDGSDLIGCAQTGTGKTAAFALPILNALEQGRRRADPCAPRVLVLSPTRELATQIAESFRTYGRNIKFRSTTIFGGVGQNPQVRALKRGVHVAIATPGRLIDLMDQGYVDLSQATTFVLDEADRMLDMGFLPALKTIIAELPKERQTVFFTATMPPKVAQLAEGLLRDPVRIEVAPESTTAERVEQRVMYVSHGDKKALLEHSLQGEGVGRTLVFTKTKHGADRLAKDLNASGIRSDAIHGNKTQNKRNRALESFRSGRTQVLVATDVAARGIDVDGVTHVVNYDLPIDPESYVHRIGRTGRAGREGIALSFCDLGEIGALRAIERLIRMSIVVDADHPFHVEPRSRGPRSGGGGNGPRRNYGKPYGRPGGKRSHSGNAAGKHGGGRSGGGFAPEGAESGGERPKSYGQGPRGGAKRPGGKRPFGGKPKRKTGGDR